MVAYPLWRACYDYTYASRNPIKLLSEAYWFYHFGHHNDIKGLGASVIAVQILISDCGVTIKLLFEFAAAGALLMGWSGKCGHGLEFLYTYSTDTIVGYSSNSTISALSEILYPPLNLDCWQHYKHVSHAYKLACIASYC